MDDPLLHTQTHTKRLGSILRDDGWMAPQVRAKDPKDPAGGREAIQSLRETSPPETAAIFPRPRYRWYQYSPW